MSNVNYNLLQASADPQTWAECAQIISTHHLWLVDWWQGHMSLMNTLS
eukprot:CAMPEP_0174310784 /NCGR_PEP_ID=MMETSP0810-20121108/3273_1 /TAXON_ID=73025 ORGANISM="Eutreptiella gymnastica-like, Strain CCMP1594" /NCGR_SAMPLE_ID=MMETSP0810 /ASSEMBLY_ACC=CAM_ASM_000659 /LENGTH=47 /DNA_ID= /DNA_START= /DNA_END= /DNA_ORIENTATION=